MKQVAVYLNEREDQWNLIKSLWNTLNKDGGLPHYLFEDKHILIRYPNDKHDYMERKLKKFTVEYGDDWNEWNDEINGNKILFADLFNRISDYAITKADGTRNTLDFLERIWHCTFNMLRNHITYKDGDWMSESFVYSRLAQRCAFSEGYTAGMYKDDK